MDLHHTWKPTVKTFSIYNRNIFVWPVSLNSSVHFVLLMNKTALTLPESHPRSSLGEETEDPANSPSHVVVSTSPVLTAKVCLFGYMNEVQISL